MITKTFRKPNYLSLPRLLNYSLRNNHCEPFMLFNLPYNPFTFTQLHGRSVLHQNVQVLLPTFLEHKDDYFCDYIKEEGENKENLQTRRKTQILKIKKFEEIREKPKIFPKYQKSKKKKKIHYLARASLKFSKKKKLAFHVKKRKFQKFSKCLLFYNHQVWKTRMF